MISEISRSSSKSSQFSAARSSAASLGGPVLRCASRATRRGSRSQCSRANRPRNERTVSRTCRRRGFAETRGECAVIGRRRVVRAPISKRASRSENRDQCVETVRVDVERRRRSLVIGCYDRAALVSRGTIMIYFRPHDGRSLRCNANARHLNVLVVPLFPLWIIGAFCVKDSKCLLKICCFVPYVFTRARARAPAQGAALLWTSFLSSLCSLCESPDDRSSRTLSRSTFGHSTSAILGDTWRRSYLVVAEG